MQLALFVLEISPRLLRVRVSFAAGLLTGGLDCTLQQFQTERTWHGLRRYAVSKQG